MNKVMGFMAGAVCGALVGAITAFAVCSMSGLNCSKPPRSWQLTKARRNRRWKRNVASWNHNIGWLSRARIVPAQ